MRRARLHAQDVCQATQARRPTVGLRSTRPWELSPIMKSEHIEHCPDNVEGSDRILANNFHTHDCRRRLSQHGRNASTLASVLDPNAGPLPRLWSLQLVPHMWPLQVVPHLWPLQLVALVRRMAYPVPASQTSVAHLGSQTSVAHLGCVLSKAVLRARNMRPRRIGSALGTRSPASNALA